jgi:uncharacterized Rmd1/YagE family protein
MVLRILDRDRENKRARASDDCIVYHFGSNVIINNSDMSVTQLLGRVQSISTTDRLIKPVNSIKAAN